MTQISKSSNGLLLDIILEDIFKEHVRFALKERLKDPEILLDDLWIKYKSTQKPTQDDSNIQSPQS